MRILRISIAGLMLAVCFVAVGFGALKNPNEYWACALFTLAVVMLVIAMVGMAFRRGNKQLFWTGYFCFGLGYLIWFYFSGDFDLPTIPTTFLLVFLNDWINNQDTQLVALLDPNDRFRQVGHLLLILPVAFLGGNLVRVFAKPEEPSR